MSYSIYAYLVDIEQLQQIHGSKDVTIVPNITDSFSEELEENNEWFESEIESGAPTLIQAVRDIVDGNVEKTEAYWWQYVYALELICKYIGTQLESDELEAIKSSGFWIVDEMEAIKDLNYSSRSPIPIHGLENLPSITYVSYDEAIYYLSNRYSKKKADLTPDQEERLVNAIEQYHSWLKEAINKRTGLVCFLY